MAKSKYKCPRCGGIFSSYSGASSHYTTVHTKGQTSGNKIPAAKDAIKKEG